MPVENLSESYLDRCISATNLYAETYNENMASEIANGICLPLGREFKQDRFRSMTGHEWQEEYEGVIRWDKINLVERIIGHDTKRVVSQANQDRFTYASNSG
jgi:hypothetical protein